MTQFRARTYFWSYGVKFFFVNKLQYCNMCNIIITIFSTKISSINVNMSIRGTSFWHLQREQKQRREQDWTLTQQLYRDWKVVLFPNVKRKKNTFYIYILNFNVFFLLTTFNYNSKCYKKTRIFRVFYWMIFLSKLTREYCLILDDNESSDVKIVTKGLHFV